MARKSGSSGPLEVRDEFGFKLGEVARLWRAEIGRQLKPMNLSFMQWTTLNQLARVDDELVQKDLAALVGMEGPAMVGVLDRLVESGWVERRVAAQDRRANTVHLTDEGRRLLRTTEKGLHEMRARLLGDVSEAELKRSIAVFAGVLERAGRS